jgi:phosphoribosyl-AMP cyclohydrolase / phosphoribosyl-ATP pyrophosphohydrolase
MIIPSIDLLAGDAVQLIGGEELAINAGAPEQLADRFGCVGEIAVIDLDAARGEGDNAAVLRALLSRAKCRVGGGIRTAEQAVSWLDAGAERVILGTAATPEILRALPRDRVIAAVDARDGEVVVDGWRRKTGRDLRDVVRELRPYVGGFLITFVEREGRLEGTALDQVADLVEVAGEARVTIAGGVSSAAEVAQLDKLGADAQVGMALYTGMLCLAEAFCAPLVSDRDDGLWPTVVTNERGVALGLTYSNVDSVQVALKRRRGVYWSRRRGLWEKGLTSGAGQRLLSIGTDCDRDALRFTVVQEGAGFCHEERYACFGDLGGLGRLERTLRSRWVNAPEGSYTQRLFDEPDLLRAKLLEEAQELAEAETPRDVAWETADLLFFALAAAARRGVSLAEVEAELDRRSRVITRRSAC